MILVTGANGALGKVMVSEFLKAGHSVLASRLGPFQEPIESQEHSHLRWVQMDLSKPQDLILLSQSQNQGQNRGQNQGWVPEAVIHCAGGFRFGELGQHSEEDWNFLIQANLSSSFHLLQAFLPGMKDRGAGSWVFIGAAGALHPQSGMGPYAATKAGLHALVQASAAEGKASGVRVNALLPSVIDTPSNREAMPQSDHSQWVRPEEIARWALELTNPQSQVTGALLPVTGTL